MFYIKRLRFLFSCFGVFVILGAVPFIQTQAADLSNPEQVVNDYLAALAGGDIDALTARIDGRMKTKNRALELSPETYSKFLQDHYKGVQTYVEAITPQGEKLQARVRFDYPTADSSIIVLILAQTDGQWKIVNEEF